MLVGKYFAHDAVVAGESGVATVSLIAIVFIFP